MDPLNPADPPGSGLLPPIAVPRGECAAIIDAVRRMDLSTFLPLVRRIAADLDFANPNRTVTVAEVLRVPRVRGAPNFVHLLLQSWGPAALAFLDGALGEFTSIADEVILADLFAASDGHGHPVVLAAAESGALEMIALMRARGLCLGTSGRGGVSAVHVAAHRGQMAVLTALLEAGVVVNLCNDVGETPLHWAVASGDAQKVDALLRAGAAASMGTSSALGETPAELAQKAGREDMLMMMAAAMSVVESITYF